MTGARIDFVGVTGHYGDYVALHKTDLSIESGEFFALLGPSGSGKSTLLNAITGFNPPSSGQVLVDGTNVTGVPPYKRNIGMVFQNYALFPFLTVFQNVAFPLQTRKLPKDVIRRRVEQSLAMVRLTEMADRLPRQLSGGQQQRVALARASVYNPPVLLMDEPLGALDKNLREELQDEIRQFHRQVGATIVYVTHDQAEAAALADRVAILNGGRIEQIDTPRKLYENPRNAFVAGFLGEANRFAITGATEAPDGMRLQTREGMILSAMESGGSDAIVCVRPERVSIGTSSNGWANAFSGVVIDAVFSTGSMRYRVNVEGTVVLVRTRGNQEERSFTVGEPVYVGWDRKDTIVVSA